MSYIVTFTPVNLGGPDPAEFGRTAGDIIGGPAALDVADEASAYIEVDVPKVVTFTLVPDKPTPPADQLIQVWWAAQFRLMEPPPSPAARDYVVTFLGEFFAGEYTGEEPPTHSTSWITTETSRFPLGYGSTAEDLYTAWAFDPTLIGAVDAAQRTQVSWLRFYAEFPGGPVDGRLAIDTHDHPFHVVGTRDPAMPYELVIDTGTQRLVEIVAGEESLATHELVIDETGRAGDPWAHCGLFRPL